MLKRFITGGIIAVLAVFILVAALLLMRRDTGAEVRAEMAVPRHALFYIDNIDFEFLTGDFIDGNQLWNEAGSVPWISASDSLLRLLKSNLKQAVLLNELVMDGRMSMSLHLQGKKTLAALFYIEPGGEVHPGEVENAFRSMLGSDAIINDRKYEAEQLYDVSLQAGGAIPQLSYCMMNGLLMVSTSSLMVEEAIRTLHSGRGAATLSGFTRVAETAGKYVHGNLYLNYAELGSLLQPVVSPGAFPQVERLDDFAQWGSLDIDLKEDAWLFSGMTVAGDTAAQWLEIFRGQSPVRGEILSAVPSNAITLFSMGISDPETFREHLEDYLGKSGNLPAFRAEDKRLQSVLGSSPLTDLLEVVDDEVVAFTLDPDASGNSSRLVMYEVSSASRAMEMLKGWVDGYSEERGLDRQTLVDEYVLDQQTSYSIFHIPMELYEGLLPEPFMDTYMALYDHYLVFSDNRLALERTIYQNVLHKTLVNDPAYEDFSEYVSTRSNLTWIIKPGPFMEMALASLNVEGMRLAASLEPVLRKVPGMVFQLMREGEMYYGNISVRYTGKVKERALTVWESLLDTVALMKPQLVVNHYTNEKEILIQDASHMLYLVNSTGRILWKVRLDEPILSEIFQVDYYSNGKLQYLFNTRSALHLLDRNGNYVERYPVNLRADATNGMALFDYDNTGDYRIFVACEDLEIYLYDLEGNIVPGWKPRKSDAVISKPLQHFRVDDMDYIVCSDPIRTYILNRRGRERVKIKEMPVVSENNQFYLDMNTIADRPRIVSSDTAGNVIGIGFKGEVEMLLEHDAQRGHFFRMEDMDQDGVPEYIFASENELEVIDAKNKRVFSFKIKSDISMLPDVYQFSATDIKLGITDRERNMIYLVNPDGSVYEGFPLEGSTRFSIGYFAGSDSRFNLIVGSDNGFLYNYSIE